MSPRRPTHRSFAVDSSHWRRDGQPKNRYRTQAEAMSAADERRWENGVELATYRCGFCDGWHMGQRRTRDD